MNRLTSAAETGGTSEWNQSYTYDQWGNHTVSGYVPYPYASPVALTEYTNNRWMGAGVSYDLNGNQTALQARTYSYDAENRLTATTPALDGRNVPRRLGHVSQDAGPAPGPARVD